MRALAVAFVICSALSGGAARADIPPMDPMAGAAARIEPAVLIAPAPRTLRPYGYSYQYVDPRAGGPAYRTYGGWQGYGRAPGSAPYRPYYNRYGTRPWSERSHDWRPVPRYRWAGATRYRTGAPRTWVDRRDWRW